MGHTSVPASSRCKAWPYRGQQQMASAVVARRGHPTRTPCAGSAGVHHPPVGCWVPPRGCGGAPEGLWGRPAEPREGAARTELGLRRLPGQAARGIALELALAVPRASCPGCPTSPPASPHPGTPLPACGCTAGREEAPQSSRAPNGGRLISGPSGPPHPLSATAVGPGWARSPPSAPPSPRGVSPWGRPLGSLPPRSFLKFQIHLSQEEGKLLPLKPLALSSKSSLLGQHRLRAPAGPGG